MWCGWSLCLFVCLAWICALDGQFIKSIVSRWCIPRVISQLSNAHSLPLDRCFFHIWSVRFYVTSTHQHTNTNIPFCFAYDFIQEKYYWKVKKKKQQFFSILGTLIANFGDWVGIELSNKPRVINLNIITNNNKIYKKGIFCIFHPEVLKLKSPKFKIFFVFWKYKHFQNEFILTISF